MRPAEAADLHLANFTPPVKPGQWGEFRLSKSAPSVASRWTDSDTGRRESRQLKHRAEKDFRIVPCHPRLAALIADHLDQFGIAPDGRLVRGARGGPLADSVTSQAWRAARVAALSPEDFAAGIAQRPCDLRHACVTGWLNAGVDPAQVAAWAGHSVAVLMRVYVGCIAGRDEIARRRIEAAFEGEEETAGDLPKLGETRSKPDETGESSD